MLSVPLGSTLFSIMASSSLLTSSEMTWRRMFVSVWLTMLPALSVTESTIYGVTR